MNNKKTRRSRAKLHPPDQTHALLTVEEITKLPTVDQMSFSLKVYAAAFFIGMQEYTGDPYSAESWELLQICSDEIARGHEMGIR